MTQNKLPILAGPEYGNATKTYTNSTAASIIARLRDRRLPWQKDAEGAAEIFPPISIASLRSAANSSQFCRGAANTEVIGRGQRMAPPS